MQERSLFFNSSWGLLAQLFRGLAAVIFIPFIIHQIGLVQYGMFSIVLLFSLYQGIISLFDFGYPGFLINRLSRYTQENISAEDIQRINLLQSYFLVICALTALVLFLDFDWISLYFNIAPEHLQEFRLSVSLILTANFFSAFSLVCSSIWIAKHRNAQFKQLDTAGYFIYIGLGFLFLSLRNGMASLAFAFLISQIFLALTMLFRTFKTFKYFPNLKVSGFKFSKEEWLDWKPFFFARLNGTAIRQSDVTILSLILGPAAVAIYDISMKLPSVIKGFSGRISEVMAPFVSLNRNKDKNLLIRDMTEDLVNIQFALCVTYYIFILFFGDVLLRYIVADEFEKVYSAFMLGNLLVLLTPHNSILGIVLMAQGSRRQEMAFWPTFVSFFCVAMAIPTTLYFGVHATILVTIFQFFMLQILFVVWAKRDFDFRFFSGFLGWVFSLAFVSILQMLFKNYVYSSSDELLGFVLKTILNISFCLLGVGFIHKQVILRLLSSMRRKATSIGREIHAAE